MQKFILSTIMGVEKLAKREIEKQGGKIEEVVDRLITFSGNTETMIKVNLWSRVGNKVYILMNQVDHVTDFDTLYDNIFMSDFKKYYKPGYRIVVKTSSQRSQLESAPSIQKIAKKAIVDNITQKSGEFLHEDEYKPKLEILILLVNNTLRVMMDTSGDALHMRGYRSDTGEAPIKESLAAALVGLANWKYKTPLYDPFCGSGTLLIEAAMIAKNMAPGLERSFAFESLGMVNPEDLERQKTIARGQQFEGKYTLVGSDIDTQVLEIAQQNASQAGVEDSILFIQKDFLDFALEEKLEGTLVSNPPYGERLQVDDITKLYKNIDRIFRTNPELNGGVITSFEGFDGVIESKNYKKRKLYNGGEKCYFYGRL